MNREDIHGTEDKHPAYGLIEISRRVNSRCVLVDSSIYHSETIAIRIKRARRNRNFNQDRFFEDGQLIEIEMSPVQFAHAITSMNTSGTPCTLRWIADEGDIPGPELDHARQRITEEFKKDVAHVAGELDEIRQYIETLESQGSVKKGDIKKLKELFQQVYQDIRSDLPFVAKQFDETVEQTLTQAKGELEAYVLHRTLELGHKVMLEQSGFKAPELQLEGPES